MSFRSSLARNAFVASVLIAPPAASAQHSGPQGGSSQASAPREASQFGFLIGQWALTVTPKVNSLAARIHGAPTYKGSWKAWRAFDGYGIEDELRIADRSGNPNSLSHALRIFDVTGNRWTQTVLDVYRGRFTTATGAWKDGAMRFAGESTDAEGKRVMYRSRFFDITPTSFRFESDRSTDGGRTWDTGAVKIAATRVSAVAPR